MVDTSNSGAVTSKAFLQAAKECLEAEKRVRAHDREVQEVLGRMADYIRKNYVSEVEKGGDRACTG